ncbi:methyltransferase domain-containing protein [Rhodobacteraceae bacterium 2CG4]|uniref:Methyltransferase domain-containing protein n=1 Tax=Halovulum marinum TaxID=2662447 RepID=A0A6L5YZW9_9RHOB|nr:class I SAM-dependent methyltransferase [Halovulum marinum]MSU89778.1 methyltransferase domain-containing protein [Halovulum marinum]
MAMLSATTVEDGVRGFYDGYGWVGTDGGNGEDAAFRAFRPAYAGYHAAVERRTLAAFDGLHGGLLIAGCGDMPASHLDLARRFDRLACLDISGRALTAAATKLNRRAEIVRGSVLEPPFDEGGFDAVFCAHVLFHIDIDLQERAVDRLLRLLRPGGRLVVIYSNPRSPVRFATAAAERARRLLPGAARAAPARPDLYFRRHPLGWWQRFADRARIDIRPWDVIGSRDDRALLWSDRAAKRFYAAAGRIEARHPRVAAALWHYPMIVLERR